MENYVTLLDSCFLPQGLALHASMERHIKDYTLWILCVDDEAYETLSKLDLHRVSLLKLSALETEDLLQVKPNRSKGEYCWTVTPFAPQFVFNQDDKIDRVTYLDADVWFLKNPSNSFSELEVANKSVLITKHSFHPEYDFADESGMYCVQYIVFCRTSINTVLKWWQHKCLEWCYAKHENGKFGDQMYLNDWPKLFPDFVHVWSYGGYTLAPWNSNRYPISDAIIYHFQGLRILDRKTILITPPLQIPKPTLKHAYEKYIVDLNESMALLEKNSFLIKSQRRPVSLLEKVIGLYREIKRLFYKIGFARVVRLK